MATFVKTTSGTWHYKWCSYVFPDTEPVDRRDEKPTDGRWNGDTCAYCLGDE